MSGTPATMRAAVFEAAGSMVVRELPVEDPGPGEALVRVTYCGVCGSDLSVFGGGALSGPEVVLGHELSAAVVDDPTDRLPPGTRVAVFPARGCGRCRWCELGQVRFCLDPPPGGRGGFAEYAAYPADSLIPIPQDLDPKTAALADPLGVATRAVPMAEPNPGDVAYVSGLGPIGLATVSVLAAVGCTVVGGDPRPDRRELAARLGCAEVIDPTWDDAYDAARAHDPYGPQLAFECSGDPEALQEIFDACAPLGTIGILGIPKSPTLLLRMTVREQRAFSIAGPTKGTMATALEHLLEHPELAEMITDVIPLEELGPTMAALAAGGSGVKVLVDPGR